MINEERSPTKNEFRSDEFAMLKIAPISKSSKRKKNTIKSTDLSTVYFSWRLDVSSNKESSKLEKY